MTQDYSKTRDFGWALAQLKQGYLVCRRGWNGKGMWLELQRPDAHSKMSLPYIYMKTATEDLVPWLASQTDMLSEDWEYASIPADVRLPAGVGTPGKHIPHASSGSEDARAKTDATAYEDTQAGTIIYVPPEPASYAPYSPPSIPEPYTGGGGSSGGAGATTSWSSSDYQSGGSSSVSDSGSSGSSSDSSSSSSSSGD